MLTEKKMPTVSIIVPVYRTEPYLRRCVDSILAQTYTDFELILVDDGSPDGCPAICDEYAEKDNRVRVIHQKNGGTCKAKNAGIRMATGKYITFTDSDDVIPEGVYEKCSGVLDTESSPDIICFGIAYVTMSGETYPTVRNKIPTETILDKSFIESKILPPLLNIDSSQDYFIENYTVNKFFLREIMTENNIVFDETRRTWEDRPFVVEFFKYANTFYYIPTIGYHYIQTPNSLSVSFSPDKLEIILKNIRLYESLFSPKFDLRSEYSVGYYCRSFINICIDLVSDRNRRNETLNAISDFCADPLGQELFTDFVPNTDAELKIRTAVLSNDAEKIYRLARSALNKFNRKKHIQRSIIYRAIRKAHRILSK